MAYYDTKKCNTQTYLCSRSSCSKNDLITGTASLSVLLEKLNSLVPWCSVKTMSNNDLIKAGSGGVALPKHRLETSSMKNDLHCLWNCFFTAELQINKKQNHTIPLCVSQFLRHLFLFNIFFLSYAQQLLQLCDSFIFCKI